MPSQLPELCFQKKRGDWKDQGWGHTKETGNRNTTEISENCYQPELHTWYWTEKRKFRKQQRSFRRFGRTCRLQLQSKNKPRRKPAWSMCQAELCLLLASPWFLLSLRPWRWRTRVPPKRQLTFNQLHGVIGQQTELFIKNTTYLNLILRHF
jgi:hypothetical protein